MENKQLKSLIEEFALHPYVNSGVVGYEEDENPRSIVNISDVDIDDEMTANNSWLLFEEKLQGKIVDITTESEVRSHLELAKKLFKKE